VRGRDSPKKGGGGKNKRGQPASRYDPVIPPWKKRPSLSRRRSCIVRGEGGRREKKREEGRCGEKETKRTSSCFRRGYLSVRGLWPGNGEREKKKKQTRNLLTKLPISRISKKGREGRKKKKKEGKTEEGRRVYVMACEREGKKGKERRTGRVPVRRSSRPASRRRLPVL